MDTENPIKTTVMGRNLTFIPVTEFELKQIKSHSILADICMWTSSLLGAGYFAENKIIYLLGAIIALIFCLIFLYQKYNFIHTIQRSGTTDRKQGSELLEKLEIIRATYGSENKSVEIADLLRQQIQNNRLQYVVTNDIAGDPDPGTPKTLALAYKFGDSTVMKSFNELEEVNVP